MLTARRMRERQAEEAAGLPPPAPARRQDIPWYEHEAALRNLEERLRRELVAGSATFEIKFDEEPFKSAVADLVAEFEQRAAEVVAQVERLEAWKAALLPEGHERPTLEDFVAGGYKAEAYDEHMLEWEAEIVGAKASKLEAEVLTLKGQLEATGNELLEWKAAADVPAAKAELAAAGVARVGDIVQTGDLPPGANVAGEGKPPDAPPQGESEAAKASGKGPKKPADKSSK